MHLRSIGLDAARESRYLPDPLGLTDSVEEWVALAGRQKLPRFSVLLGGASPRTCGPAFQYPAHICHTQYRYTSTYTLYFTVLPPYRIDLTFCTITTGMPAENELQSPGTSFLPAYSTCTTYYTETGIFRDSLLYNAQAPPVLRTSRSQAFYIPSSSYERRVG